MHTILICICQVTVSAVFQLASPSEDFSSISGQAANLAARILYCSVEVDELTLQDGITVIGSIYKKLSLVVTRNSISWASSFIFTEFVTHTQTSLNVYLKPIL